MGADAGRSGPNAQDRGGNSVSASACGGAPELMVYMKK